ncbi:GTPase (G3E family) [Anaerosacchariphilus sp. NSJ-68]|uniref:GTPase (G3E family) n=2 Tax=Lachnospiraceae TaxID=186803 RepID=A0A923LEI1_9FIRM|nr:MULTISPECIES: GTP-binding protein [Lachnospiraceae]MBC5660644.1 GTPase (G3E family) [Anaerosacchariphilus hominis]MBC5699507.1 GTPase (G3E family) [Roseburia difficilis]
MVKVDLITGFLGSGKTTFIRTYASWLIKQGYHIGILENDFGAVNVDMMLLQDLEGDRCELEMVSGGCDRDCHRRRFKTKLIAMGMSGYDRVLVEPSGIFDVDEFFDVLHEEPLDRWYEIGNVLAVVDAKLEPKLSVEADYLLATEVADAGIVLLSRTQESSQEQIRETKAHLNRALEQVGCSRRLKDMEILEKNWAELSDGDFQQLLSCGYVPSDYEKADMEEDQIFDSLFFMHLCLPVDELKRRVEAVFRDPACGSPFRIKGFMQVDGDGWIELNATRHETVIRPISRGQEILIVIGERLCKGAVKAYFPEAGV